MAIRNEVSAAYGRNFMAHRNALQAALAWYRDNAS